MEKCEKCCYCRVYKGSCRGVMDCDPDELYCAKDYDEYFYNTEEEMLDELKEEFINKKMLEGMSKEDAKALAEEEEFDMDMYCPYFCEIEEYDPYYYYEED